MGKIEQLLFSCLCHSDEIKKHFGGVVNCPLIGCRVVCLAYERLGVYAYDAGQASEASIIRKLPRKQIKVSRPNCMSVFGKCKSLKFTNSVIRTKEFKALPLLMFRIAVEDNLEDLLALAIVC